MSDIALYHPYFFVRDEDWLKACALYWPKLARAIPADYQYGAQEQGDVAQILRDELDFILDIDPAPVVAETSLAMTELIQQRGDEILELCPVPDPRTQRQARRMSKYTADPGFGYVSAAELDDDASDALVESGLAVELASLPRGDEEWLAMHPALARAYTESLLARLAAANQLQLVTDQLRDHQGPPAEDIAAGLGLGGAEDEVSDVERARAGYALLAIETVIPGDLTNISAHRIARIRRDLAPSFDAFRQHLADMTDTFTDLAGTSDVAVLGAKLELLVAEKLTRPRQELAAELRSAGLSPVRALLSLKSMTPTVLAGAAANWLGAPAVVTAAGVAAAAVVTAAAKSRQRADELRRSAPGYLLGLSDMTASGFARWLRF